MNFQQLRAVREAIRKGFNLTEAADVLCTSQSGVSRQLRELEEELGVTIFERHGKRLTGLTAPGRDIARIIERILVEKDNLKDAADEYLGFASGRLTVASTHAQSRYRLPGVVTAFREAFPNVKLALHQTSPAQIVEMVRDGRADLGFATESLSRQSDFALFKAYSWWHRVVVPIGHPLTRIEQPTLVDIAQYPIITYEEGMTGRGRINQAFFDQRVTPNIVLTAIDSDVIKTYVELGLGIGIVAEMAYNPQRDTKLECLSGNLVPPNVASIAVRRGTFLRGYAIAFIQMLIPGLSAEAIRVAVENSAEIEVVPGH
ncbi:LysR family transcriptional regulator [Pseudomonas sp. ABC1]|uniref:LysR substrate-binding domain-containing protein n=1 Tax=Pseudomonas sp. ABC1 TaxID=2748080 RepID=UPI0015C2D650|nr:LysR substrate-binding domain-containing protein [Pseudomonas sp. ABC1]QLF93983.1 LysR family transcriptional regulator [Pseudomonas sp. ABC1]